MINRNTHQGKATITGNSFTHYVFIFLLFEHYVYSTIFHAGPAKDSKLHARKIFWVPNPMELVGSWALCRMIKRFILNYRIGFVLFCYYGFLQEYDFTALKANFHFPVMAQNEYMILKELVEIK